ncbi:MAG: hypothetical protein LC624_00615 [Halobacteriales archaeon]|nr:hypothetical protein [Halobacteriales archaeon]
MGRILLGLAAVALLLVLLAAGLYATDYGVGATITQKGNDSSGYYIVAHTQFGLDVKKPLPLEQWVALSVGNFVVYHVQSGHTKVYDREGGALLYSG